MREARMSTPTTQRWRESMKRKVGRRPRPTDFTDSAFEDQRLAEQFADEQAGDAAAHVHEPGQVRARNRLMSANQVESDLPVDFAAGTAPGDLEIVWIDLTHRYCSLLRLIK